MPTPNASLLVTAGLAGIAVAVAVLVLRLFFEAYSEARPRIVATVVVGVWMAGFFGLARAGFFADLDARPPRVMLIGLAAMGSALAISLSRVGERIATRVPLAWIVGLMAFRLPLELVMHQAASEGVMPVRMSFSGANFDIVTGALALPVAILWARGVLPRSALLAWNVLGLITVAVVMSIGIASTPRFHAFGVRPEDLNTWIFHAPFIWLPTVLVATAVAGHLIVFRALASGGLERSRGRAVR